MICANRVPDHVTIARFRARHQNALGERGYTQGYNAQAVTTEGQIIVAADADKRKGPR